MHKLALALTLLLTAPALAEDQSPQQYQNLLTPLLSGGTDVLGTALAYPDGPVNITAAIVTIPPGGTTGTNTGTVPMKLLAVYMGGGTAANTLVDPAP